MIWLTWRQHRLQLIVVSACLLVLTLFLLLSGTGIASTFRDSGLARCLADQGRDCGSLSGTFSDRYSVLRYLLPLFLILPGIVGVFLGAPLVAREIEQGTHRLVWTQSITRERWIVVKLAILGVATVVASAIFSWALTWWSRPFVLADANAFSPGPFDLRGLVPVAYALFGLALGVALGAMLRRTVAAMAATIAGYTAIRIGVALWLRPHYEAAKTISYSVLGNNPRSGLGDWVLKTNSFDASGHLMGAGNGIDLGALSTRCPGLIPTDGHTLPDQAAVNTCIHRVGLHAEALYQPGTRFWLFQSVEAAIFSFLAFTLFISCVWWVRRTPT